MSLLTDGSQNRKLVQKVVFILTSAIFKMIRQLMLRLEITRTFQYLLVLIPILVLCLQ